MLVELSIRIHTPEDEEMNGGECKEDLPHPPDLLLAITMATPVYRRRGVTCPSLRPFEYSI
jgi:hypothetical protein